MRQSNRIAVGLDYSYRDTAPAVVRRGEAEASLELLKEARRYGIPILEDEKVARRILAEEHLPEDLYERVAEAFIRYKIVD